MALSAGFMDVIFISLTRGKRILFSDRHMVHWLVQSSEAICHWVLENLASLRRDPQPKSNSTESTVFILPASINLSGEQR